MPAHPADTGWTRGWFRARLWCEARLVPLRIAGKTLDQMLAMFEPRDSSALPRFPLDYVGRSVHWAVRAPLLMRNRRCLRSGLLGYEVLRQAGYAPQLHFSVDRGAANSVRVEAHCWVSIDGRPVVNAPNAGHVLLFSYPQQQRPAG